MLQIRNCFSIHSKHHIPSCQQWWRFFLETKIYSKRYHLNICFATFDLKNKKREEKIICNWIYRFLYLPHNSFEFFMIHFKSCANYCRLWLAQTIFVFDDFLFTNKIFQTTAEMVVPSIGTAQRPNLQTSFGFTIMPIMIVRLVFRPVTISHYFADAHPVIHLSVAQFCARCPKCLIIMTWKEFPSFNTETNFVRNYLLYQFGVKFDRSLPSMKCSRDSFQGDDNEQRLCTNLSKQKTQISKRFWEIELARFAI